MPRVNLCRDKHEQLIKTLWGAKAVSEKTDDELARAIGMTRQTLTTRRKRPETFTIGELEKLGRALNVPIDELRSGITY
jgi:DNA-binding Xre family transcriptional regulator